MVVIRSLNYSSVEKKSAKKPSGRSPSSTPLLVPRAQFLQFF
jgi:hypothetical protein